MAYHQEGNELVIDGFEKGIADNPFVGLADIRNANLVSTPGECAVNFSTSQISYPVITGVSVTSSDATGDTITFTGGALLENAMAVTFSVSNITGVSTGTIYWLGPITSNTTCQLFTDQARSVLVNIQSNGTGTFATLNIAQPKHYAIDTSNASLYKYFVIDSSGYVWGNNVQTGTNNYWTFTGNITVANANGNGLVYYQGSNGTGWLFAMRNKRIDYTQTGTIGWVYGWQPASGASGGDAFVSGAGANNSHFSLVGQDNAVYMCDANYLGSFFEKTGQIFDPTNTATYTYAQKALTIPFVDIAQWLTELGQNLLVAGMRNLVYPWDRVSTTFSYPIFLSETNVQRMVTVNTNAYLFTGTRGRIFITNGTQAQLYAKVPDHISGTEDPIFTWGAVGYHKNQLYFGVKAQNAAGTNLTTYGGLWAIDLDTKALRGVNQLSFNSGGTFAGYATVFVPILGNNVNQGTGFFVGWDSNSSTYGIDATFNPATNVSSPYTNYDTYVESDMIPVGTYLKNKTFETFEYKLSRPLVSGENVRLKMRNDLTTSFTTIGTSGTSDVGNMSGVIQGTPMERNQYLQLRAELNSTATNPSYVRLTQIRARAQTTVQMGAAVPL